MGQHKGQQGQPAQYGQPTNQLQSTISKIQGQGQVANPQQGGDLNRIGGTPLGQTVNISGTPHQPQDFVGSQRQIQGQQQQGLGRGQQLGGSPQAPGKGGKPGGNTMQAQYGRPMGYFNNQAMQMGGQMPQQQQPQFPGFGNNYGQPGGFGGGFNSGFGGGFNGPGGNYGGILGGFF